LSLASATASESLFSLGAAARALRSHLPECKGGYSAGPAGSAGKAGSSPSSLLGSKKYLGVTSPEVLEQPAPLPLAESFEAWEIPRIEAERPPLSVDEETFRHSGWAAQRRRMFAGLRRCCVSASRLDAFAKCGSFATMEYSNARKRYRVRGNYCHDRFCEPCARARAGRAKAAILRRVTKDRLRFLTLTLRHSTAPLLDQLKRLRKCFSQLRHLPVWKAAVSGGAVFLEVKVGRDGLWHPHLHIMAEGTWLDWRVLRAAWLVCTGDSDNVDLRAPKGDAKEAIAAYLTTYVTKSGVGRKAKEARGPLLDPDTGQWTDAALEEFILAMKGQHQIDFLGSWRKWEKEEEAGEEELADDWEFVGSIDHLLHRARGGDPIARYLLFGEDSEVARRYREAREAPA
jgi:hypothetical protein